MNTATVLLENIIQGIQTGLWIVLLIFSFIDYTPLLSFLTKDNLALAGVVLLALTYWLGIMVDTVYYHVFIQAYEARWAAKRLAGKKLTLSKMVFRCIVESPDLARLLHERQAHLRMLRVSMINIVLITFAVTIFLASHETVASLQIKLLVVIGGAAFFIATAFAWRKLYAYYITIAQHGYSAIVVSHRAKKSIKNSIAAP